MISKKLKRFVKRLIRRFEPVRWLFLDDLRQPPLHLNRMFDVVRSYDDFIEYIETYGVPELISMDHDLDREHTLFFYDNGGFRNPPDPKFENFKFKTGYDCALWLIEYCKDNNLELKKVIVHSHNPIGSNNIYEVISGYQLKINKTISCKIKSWKHQK
jgi:hypothetical protein